jgi:hypothetical protein
MQTNRHRCGASRVGVVRLPSPVRQARRAKSGVWLTNVTAAPFPRETGWTAPLSEEERKTWKKERGTARRNTTEREKGLARNQRLYASLISFLIVCGAANGSVRLQINLFLTCTSWDAARKGGNGVGEHVL